MYQALDGPAVNGQITVTDTPQLLKVGATALDDRTAVVIQALDENIYWGFSNSVTASTGFKVFRAQMQFLEAGSKIEIWLVAETGKSVDTRIGEIA